MGRIGVTTVIIGAAIGVTAILSALAAEHCKLFRESGQYNGRYCPLDDAIVTLHLLPRQCRYICITSPTCKAYNYNTTRRSCARFASPCLQAIPDTVMEFAVFTEKTMDQCYEWVPYSSGDAVDPRMISTDDAHHMICRMQRSGDDRMGYLYTTHSKCYASWGPSQFDNKQGYPCQRLRITEDCTVYWVPYTAGRPIHPRSVIGGHMANGDVVYVTKFDYSYPPVVSLAGHYVKGADHTISPAGGAVQSCTTMMMLIVL